MFSLFLFSHVLLFNIQLQYNPFEAPSGQLITKERPPICLLSCMCIGQVRLCFRGFSSGFEQPHHLCPSHTCLHARRPSSRQDAHPSDLVACYTVGYNIHDTPSFRGGDFVPFLNFWPPNSGHAWAYLHHLTATPLAAATYPRLHSLFESIDLS